MPVAWSTWLAPVAASSLGFFTGALITAVMRAREGEAPHIGRSYRSALRHAWRLIAASTAHIGAATLLSITVIGIPWALRLFVRWYFCLQVVVIDGLDVGDCSDRVLVS
jgi:hypothetical protein